MIEYLRYSCALGFLLMAAAPAHGQKATEMFIPIGESPGLSGKVTETGRIGTVNRQDRAFSMTDPDTGRSYDIQVAESTRIWLDRSGLKLTNLEGSFADIETGLLAEIKFQDNQLSGPVEWIKLRIEEIPR